MDDKPLPEALDDFLGVSPPSPLAKYRKWALMGLVVVVLAFAGWWVFARGSGATAYATETVTRGDLQVKVSATGNLAPTNEVAVGSELSGLIETVSVDVNDKVFKGQILAQIDTLRLRDTITRSGAALTSARASVGQAQATLQQTRSTLARLLAVYRLSDGKVPSGAELDTGRAEQARAVAALNVAQAGVASAQAQLNSDATNLNKATIRSPVTGVVLSRQVEPGQTVAASFNTPTLFTIAEDLTAMELEVKVDEADVGQVKQGQSAKFAVDAWPGRSFVALIKRVDVGANATTTSSSTVISYNAVLTVQNPELILRPGMTATAEIVTSETRGVLLIPNAALRFKPASTAKKATAFGMSMGPQSRPRTKQAKIAKGTQQTIYRLGAGGLPAPLLVTVGASNGTLTSVAGDGLKAGDTVITGALAAKQ